MGKSLISIYCVVVSQSGEKWFAHEPAFYYFCYFAKKVTNLRRKSRVKVQKSRVKVQKVGSKSTLLICEENYYFTKKLLNCKITNLRRKLLFCEENYYSTEKMIPKVVHYVLFYKLQYKNPNLLPLGLIIFLIQKL